MMLKGILAALALLGAPPETAGAVGAAVSKYARSPDEAAFILAWSDSESNFSPEIAAGRCARWQCDAHTLRDGSIVHLAKGLWQLHRGAAGADWARLDGDIDLQAKHAASLARWAMRACPKDPVRGGFRVLGGLGCDRPLKGEERRMRAFNKAMAAL